MRFGGGGAGLTGPTAGAVNGVSARSNRSVRPRDFARNPSSFVTPPLVARAGEQVIRRAGERKGEMDNR